MPAFAPAQSLLAPQKARSVSGSTQRIPHWIVPVAQVAAQAPLLQTSPSAQAVPALAPVQSEVAPQWVRSLSGSTQVSPHWTIAAEQVTAHAPLSQT